ncbi:hypothetical protein [Nisaea denitrificans]|uniref:hypothetical protein n=1 Tax=Nisaea denitrificans TaxID=390877 RepID=UPI0003FDF15D|nr:hypothetical protein [Nisaea denitrificans]
MAFWSRLNLYRFIVIAAVVSTVALGSNALQARQGDEARVLVESIIDDLGVDRARIRSVDVIADHQGGRSPASSYSGWISFKDCKGNLVIMLGRTLAVQSIYTTGDCEVSGVD